MVGRLVEHQEVRRVEEHARQHEARLLAAREQPAALLDVVARRSRSTPASVRSEPIDAFGNAFSSVSQTLSSPARAAPSSAARSSRASRSRRASTAPASGASAPATSFSSVDLPAPFAPITHQRSRRRIRRSRPSKTTCAPYALRTRASRATSSPERGGGGERRTRASARRFGGSTRSIFSSFFTRDCTCAAWLARALKRAMNASSLASIACWRAYCAAWLAFRERALALVEVVVARVGDQLAAVDLDDLRDHAVQELAVVRGHHQRALEGARGSPRARGSTRGRGGWSARRAAARRAASPGCAPARRASSSRPRARRRRRRPAPAVKPSPASTSRARASSP